MLGLDKGKCEEVDMKPIDWQFLNHDANRSMYFIPDHLLPVWYGIDEGVYATIMLPLYFRIADTFRFHNRARRWI
jgi:hypothetical protein